MLAFAGLTRSDPSWVAPPGPPRWRQWLRALLAVLRQAWRAVWRLDTLTSVGTLFGMTMLAKDSAWGWVVLLAAQGLWLSLIIDLRSWGLLPLNVYLTLVYAHAVLTKTWGPK